MKRFTVEAHVLFQWHLTGHGGAGCLLNYSFKNKISLNNNGPNQKGLYIPLFVL